MIKYGIGSRKSYTGKTLEECKRKYKLYSDAEEAVLTGKSYEIEGRKLTRENLSEIRNGMQYWEDECNRIGSGSSGGIRAFRVIAKND